MHRLDRFHTAQASAEAGFSQALAELQSTGKRTHWIWYIFPQLSGLGSSSYARAFAIEDQSEARDYLGDDLLRSRLLKATEAVRDRMNESMPLRRVMGSDIDALKLVSSLTLFERVAQRLPSAGEHSQFLKVVEQVLKRAEEQGYPRCAFTLKALG